MRSLIDFATSPSESDSGARASTAYAGSGCPRAARSSPSSRAWKWRFSDRFRGFSRWSGRVLNQWRAGAGDGGGKGTARLAARGAGAADRARGGRGAPGHGAICACGTVKLWRGVTYSSENSQHLIDWYSPSHVLHGLLFYLALHWLRPRWRLGPRIVAATLIETAWEIVENTDAMIER